MDTPQSSKVNNRMMAAVIQEQDVDIATSALVKLGLKVERLPSTGGFLGRRNATLLVVLNTSQEKAAIETLGKTCRRS